MTMLNFFKYKNGIKKNEEMPLFIWHDSLEKLKIDNIKNK